MEQVSAYAMFTAQVSEERRDQIIAKFPVGRVTYKAFQDMDLAQDSSIEEYRAAADQWNRDYPAEEKRAPVKSSHSDLEDEEEEKSEDATMINVWYTDDADELCRKVWNAAATSELPVGSIVEAMHLIAIKLYESQKRNPAQAVQGKIISEETKMEARKEFVRSKVFIGPVTAEYILKDMKGGIMSLKDEQTEVKRGAASMIFRGSDVMVRGNVDVLFSDTKIDKRPVSFRSHASSYLAAKIVLMTNDFVRSPKGWQMKATPNIDGTPINALRESYMTGSLFTAINEELLKVGPGQVAVLACVENCLFEWKDTKARKLHALDPVTREITTKVMDEYFASVNTSLEPKFIKQNFALHDEDGRLRNHEARKDVFANNATPFAYAPSAVKQTAEVFELVRYVSTIATIDKVPRDIRAVVEANTEKAWFAACQSENLKFVNKTSAGLVTSPPTNNGNMIYVHHEVCDLETLPGPMTNPVAAEAPEIFVVRVKGTALNVPKLEQWLTKDLPGHWKSYRVVKLANFHNPQFYLILSKVPVSERKKFRFARKVEKKLPTGVVQPADVADKIVTFAGKEYVEVEDAKPGVDQVQANFPSGIVQAISYVSQVAWLMEKFTHDAYLQGPIGLSGVQTVDLIRSLPDSLYPHTYMSGAPILFNIAGGVSVMNLGTDPAALAQKRREAEELSQ